MIEQRPLTAVFFLGVQVTISIGLMNLLLAVIVDRANEARHDDVKSLLKEEAKEKKKLEQHLLRVCASMDGDGTGSLTLQELYDGFRENDDFQTTLQAMDIAEGDLAAVFGILDGDGSGEVKYDEFVEEIWKMKSTDQQTMLIFIKFYVADLRNKVNDQLVTLENRLVDEHKISLEYLKMMHGPEEKKDNQSEAIEGKAEGDSSSLKQTQNASPLSRKASMQAIPDAAISQELAALRILNEETSAAVKQCSTQLQQFGLGLETLLRPPQGPTSYLDSSSNSWCGPSTLAQPMQIPRSNALVALPPSRAPKPT